METNRQEAERILEERFGKDQVIALATISGQLPSVRYVNTYYADGAFYIITYGLSNKMRQLAENPAAGIAGEWFTGHGRAENLGWFGKEENREIAAKLREVFAEWIDNGHNDFSDPNTCILRICLTDGVLFSHGKRYDLRYD